MNVKKQSGQILVLFAVGLVALIGMVGVVVDGGRAYSDERSLEAAAEAAAHAGTFLMETSWKGEAGNYGSLTDAQVRATAQAFAGYNGWNSSTDTFFLDYVRPDRTTHVATLDTTVRGVEVQLSKRVYYHVVAFHARSMRKRTILREASGVDNDPRALRARNPLG